MILPTVTRDRILIAIVIAVTLTALGGGYLASNALTQRLTRNHALNIARDFTNALAGALTVFDSNGRFTGIEGGEREAVLRFAGRVAHINRIVAIGADRVVAYDSTGEKTGLRYDKPYIHDALDHGVATVKFADADDTRVEEGGGAFIAEAYVPVLRDGRPVGVFELYLDVTAYTTSVAAVFAVAYATFAAAVLAATLVAVVLVQVVLEATHLA